MTKDKIIYWITTAFVAVIMLFVGVSYFVADAQVAAFDHMGYPWYFRLELGVFKILGSTVLLVPIFPAKLKEIAYWGYALTFLSAFIAHVAVNDSIGEIVGPIIFLIVLGVSYLYFRKRIAV